MTSPKSRSQGDDGAAERGAPGDHRLGEIALSFLRLGTIAFGGPAAHIAMMEQEFVVRRGWLSRADFLDMLGATNLIPGPNSTEMAIHIGHQRAGWKGLIVGGAAFIVPAVMIVIAFAWAYVRFGSLPQIQGIMYGIKPVMIAIVFQALWRLLPAALKSGPLILIGAVAFAAALLGAHVILVLFGAGVPVAIWAWVKDRRAAGALGVVPFATLPQLSASAAAVAMPFSLIGLFLFFMKVGAILYGSGYVLLAFLQADLVDRMHWLTQSQLLDAVAVGQVTPGPVFTTATFIGYLLGGAKGGIVATIGIFVPSFVFVAASRPLIPRIRRSAVAGAFLDGVNAGSLALMAAVTIQLSHAAFVDATTLSLGVVAAAVLVFSRLNSTWLIFAGALIGLVSRTWLG
ncbi:MAG: chromate efflux transporter [Candidatus Binataceae bacterium]